MFQAKQVTIHWNGESGTSHMHAIRHLSSIGCKWQVTKLWFTCVKGKLIVTHKACSNQAWLNHGSLLMLRNRRWSRQAFRNTPKAQCTFKFLMIHEILLFSMLITFCCTLHHHPSQDIQCWKLWWHRGLTPWKENIIDKQGSIMHKPQQQVAIA